MSSIPRLQRMLRWASCRSPSSTPSRAKTSDAEKILDNLIKNPTITVSKDEAQLALAKVKAKSDPDGARKILESLRTERTAISKAAMSALGDLAGQTN